MGSAALTLMTASMSSRLAYPSAYIRTASLRYPNSSRFATNPARSPTVTATLPSRATSSRTAAVTAGSVTTVVTTSTSRMTGAGLKKCSPTTRPCRPVAAATSVTDRELVLVASIGPEGRPGPARRTAPALQAEPLRHRLDDEVHIGQVCEPDGERDPAQQRVALLGAEPPARHRPPGGPVEDGPSPPEGVVAHLDGGHVQPAAREHLDDPGPHRPEPDHPDPADPLRHAAPPCSIRFRKCPTSRDISHRRPLDITLVVTEGDGLTLSSHPASPPPLLCFPMGISNREYPHLECLIVLSKR